MAIKSAFYLRDGFRCVDKAPGDELVYGFDTADWNTAEATTAISAVWTVPDGLTKAADSVDTDEVLAKLTGGTVGQEYAVSVAITFANGEKRNPGFIVVMKPPSMT